MEKFRDITRSGAIRRPDSWGAGHFGAGRGSRVHHGVDFAAAPGEEVFSPIDGDVVRQAVPYADDPRYVGVVIRGAGAWIGIEVRLFYVVGERSGPVKAGERVGRAQSLLGKYPGIGNHVHLEVRQGTRVLSPDEAFWQCLGTPR